MKLLALDSATEYCSVALWLDGALLERSAPPTRGLSEHLLEWAAALLAEAGIGLTDLDALAFGRGPGAFTGVRMATSIVQGLALSSGLPVIPVSTLRTVALRALAEAPAATQVLVCQDARMHELYCARYRRVGADASLQGVESLAAPATVSLENGVEPGVVAAAGSGFGAYAVLAQRWAAAAVQAPAHFRAEPLACPPRASDVARLAVLDGMAMAVSAELALPVYLRNDVARPSPPLAL